jgi:hypothetical protein
MELKPCPFCGGESEGVSDKGVVYGCIIHKRECPICEMIGAMPQRQWEAWNHRPTEDALRAERDALREKVERQHKGLKAVEDLINESDGVYGYHLNGDLSPWGDFLEGGCNEAYLMEFEEALEGGE